MKLDSTTKTLLAVMVVCLFILCVAQVRLASSVKKAVALTEAELEKRRELERELAKALAPRKRPAPLGFTAVPFSTQ